MLTDAERAMVRGTSRRRIVQIAISLQGTVYALADDGTLWVRGDEWHEIPGLPPKAAEKA